MQDPTDPIIEQKRLMYITSLLNETLPSHMLSDNLMSEMAMDSQDILGLVQILYNNQLQDAIEAKDSDTVADWKAVLHHQMMVLFDAPFIHTSCVLNLAPYTRTIVYSFHAKDLHKLKPHITEWFNTMNTYLLKKENAQMMAFANPQQLPFKDIGKLYKELRTLQGYQYVIGMGTITFYESFNFSDDTSVTEYKYIQRYELLLTEDDYAGLLTLIQELATYILTHVIKDSKVIYIYKELMSITIRHLYNHETEHLKLINMLNYTINNFSNEFNDLKDVSHYIQNLMSLLQETASDRQDYHPHIKKIIEAIKKNYNNDLTLDSMATQLNLTSAHLSRLFKGEVGISYKQYLTKYRLNLIKKLLITTDKTIQEIAILTGYQSANQLTRIFKKYEQITPKNYRLRHHK